jgi:hypothetical protein
MLPMKIAFKVDVRTSMRVTKSHSVVIFSVKVGGLPNQPDSEITSYIGKLVFLDKQGQGDRTE